uniref:Reverse transcriptase zinc-binding domain-containing protein n=1 Tax=Quercus lobata TaxID=97700 RepID=A0A7N2QXT7_QUELO
MLSRKNDNKLSGWKEKILSQAEKEIFIKAVAQASPTAVVTPETVKSGLTHREVFSQSVAPTKLHSPSLPRPTQVEHPLTKLNTSSGVQSGFFTSHPKLKTFTWRAWRNILPTKVNLCHRGVLEDATCEACQLDEETSGHLFWHCTRALETWEAIGLPLDTRGKQVNVDAAVLKNTKSVGIGIIVRDHEGIVVAALSKRLPLPLGPLEAEAKAMDEAASFAADIGLQEAIFEMTDCAVLAGALSDTTHAPITIENSITASTLSCRPSKSSRSHMSDDKATNQLTLWLSTPKDLTLLYRG